MQGRESKWKINLSRDSNSLYFWDGSTYDFKAVCLGVSRDCMSFLDLLHSVRLKGKALPVLRSAEFSPCCGQDVLAIHLTDTRIPFSH